MLDSGEVLDGALGILEENPDDEEALAHARRFDNLLTFLLTLAALASIYLGVLEANLALSEIGAEVIIAESNLAQLETYSTTESIQNYRIYTQYAINKTLENTLVNDPDQLEINDYILSQAFIQSDIARFYFPSRYIQPDGSYDLERNQQDIIAERSRRLDIDPQDDYARYQDDTALSQNLMLISLISLASLGIYALEKTIYPLRWRLRLLMITTATILLFMTLAFILQHTIQGSIA